ncbi:hypothetical protein B0H13DRAFT_2270325 [Mycena leptocephala]|nr:hypothetical protein B0H13DRAFT_2270325 [Mycena leptocephala]
MFSTPKFATFAAISCLSLAVIPIVRSAVIEVTVGGVGVIAYTPNQVQANIGDVIQFTFKQKNHTITRSTLANPVPHLWEREHSTRDSANETDFPLAQFTVQDTNPVWVYCRQAGHCTQGMAAATGSAATSAAAAPTGAVTVTTTITVSGAPIPAHTLQDLRPPRPPRFPPITSSLSVEQPVVYTPSNITAQPGDTVTFQFHSKNHTVTASSFQDPCRALSLTSTTGQLGFDSGFMAVSENATQFPTFTIQVNDATHCGQGMVFSVNAVESGPNNFGAFQAKAIQLNGTASASPSGSASNNTTMVPSFPAMESQVPQTNPAQQQGAEDEAAKRAQEEQMRRDVMATVLDTAARERLSRIALVSPERSKQIEAILLRMVQSGQLRGRVSEEQLIDLLEQVGLLRYTGNRLTQVTLRWRTPKEGKPRRKSRPSFSSGGGIRTTISTSDQMYSVPRSPTCIAIVYNHAQCYHSSHDLCATSVMTCSELGLYNGCGSCLNSTLCQLGQIIQHKSVQDQFSQVHSTENGSPQVYLFARGRRESIACYLHPSLLTTNWSVDTFHVITAAPRPA